MEIIEQHRSTEAPFKRSSFFWDRKNYTNEKRIHNIFKRVQVFRGEFIFAGNFNKILKKNDLLQLCRKVDNFSDGESICQKAEFYREELVFFATNN